MNKNLHANRKKINFLLNINISWKYLIALISLMPYFLSAQVSLSTSTYSQDFNTLSASGTANKTTLPTGWTFNETGTNANNTFTAGTGSSNTGDTYSFGVSTTSSDRALGGLQSGSLIPTIGASFKNEIGEKITMLEITYTGEQWRLGTAGRADRLDFQYSTDATSLTTGNWSDVDGLDFSSPKTTTPTGLLDGNNNANRTTITFTISGLSIENNAIFWIRWSDFNASGADDGLAIDDFSISASAAPSISATPSIISTLNYIEGNGPSAEISYALTGKNLIADVIATAPADFEISNISATTGFQDALTISPVSGSINSTIYVRLKNGLITGTYTGDIAHTGGGITTPVNVAVTGNVLSVTKISAIQGSGTTAALTGVRAIEGIVTKVFAGSTQLNGFFVQEEDSDADSDPATSEGIFIFNPNNIAVTEGDKVQIVGIVKEFVSSTSSSLTEVDMAQGGSSLKIISSGNPLPAVTNVQLPVANTSDLEKYEGMLVNMSAATGNLVVTDNFQLGRYGQVLLSVDGASNQAGTDARLDQYTQFNAPSVVGNTAYQNEIAKRSIYLDDASSVQNPAIVIFGRGGNPLSATNTLRAGDAVASISAVLDQRFEGYRLQTTEGVNFQPTNPRPTSPPINCSNLRVGGFNVLNYFNGDGLGGGFPTARGADNAAEFTRQRDKIINVLVGSGADILGINELENDGYGATSAIQDLVNGMNALAGAGTYAFITPTGSISTDQITVGIIYKTAKVTPMGAAAAIPTGFGTGSFDIVGRKPLAQTFEDKAKCGVFTYVINHFKSKGSSSGGAGDDDSGDGQGASNGTRTRQSQDLLAWLATKPTGTDDLDYLLGGDFNSYALEDPLTTIKNGGYTELLPNSSYSYTFDGQFGSLDHAFGSTSLSSQLVDATKWHVNSDEPIVLDYNTEFKHPAQVSSFYANDQFRAADHDPVLVCLDLKESEKPVIVCPANQVIALGSFECSRAVTFSDPSVSDNCKATVARVDNTGIVSGSYLSPGSYTLTYCATDPSGNTSDCSFTIQVLGQVTTGRLNCIPQLTIALDNKQCIHSLDAPSLLIDNTYYCTSVYNLTIQGKSSNYITGGDLGQTFTAVVKDNFNGSCSTTIKVIDNKAPVLNDPEDAFISCADVNSDGSVTAKINNPTIIYECSKATFTYSDKTINPSLGQSSFTSRPESLPAEKYFNATSAYNASKIIVRTYTVTDEFNNSTTVHRIIYVKKISLGEVVCPKDVTISCENGSFNTDFRNTGTPSASNGRSLIDVACNIGLVFSDEKTTNAQGGFTIKRTWTLLDRTTQQRETCVQTISVNDTKPTINCIPNKVISIAADKKAVILASDIATASDNCTPANALIWNITEGSRTNTSLTYTCADLGTKTLTVSVKDASDNISSCTTTVQIVDNNNYCISIPLLSLSGAINKETGENVPATVNIFKQGINFNSTESSNFQFSDLPSGDSYRVKPERNTDVTNGVTTFDIALMSKHILDIQPLQSPYQLIAADVNRDGQIDGVDMLLTRNLILRRMTSFPNNTAWRFIPKNYVFKNPLNPFEEDFPETLIYNNLSENINKADFVAVKVGDINLTAKADLNILTVRNNQPIEILNATDKQLEAGKEYKIDINTQNTTLSALQFALKWDKTKVTSFKMLEGTLPQFDKGNIEINYLKGIAAAAWASSPNSVLNSENNVIQLVIIPNQTIWLHDLIRLDDQMDNLAYNTEGVESQVQLNISASKTDKPTFELHQNRPNPFTNETTISFILPDDNTAELSIYDINGRKVYSLNRRFNKGYNEVTVGNNVLNNSGIYFYRLQSDTFTSIKRLQYIKN